MITFLFIILGSLIAIAAGLIALWLVVLVMRIIVYLIVSVWLLRRFL